MKIKIHGRVNVESAMMANIIADSQDRSEAYVSVGTPRGGVVALSEEEIIKFLASRAPNEKDARDEFFARVRREVDQIAPTYDYKFL